ncbi:N-acetylglucosamine-6-phosphate deacetylase [Tepidibacter formicigenes]|jgi:N-acetylglucosamine-6-phosphate deacetylase|uniref:N-acetylglucosamine-6-phosphate deacetylase n=1 Tax=Tepidibacter formicigenes DSM 15518 TaxID=1123349 RepID=A0A1M6PJK5_9FIRM|nr:N-acetylglucosamine-6-phosphate deacetylase [Tepidibacter formicigenes]SHK08103.1 N-acetylglucosamine-6-phosphate deacetylase [Tepidibacter formicigenes DSM 15518]
MKAIINGKIILEDSILNNYILLYDKEVIDIVKKDEFNITDIEEIIDAKDNFVSPGFIDLHIHGSGGFDTMDATFEAVNNISKSIVKTGVTSFLPTTMTMPKKDIINALENIKKCINKVEGAKIYGVHLEGPFINKKYKGAQNEKYILKPDYEFIKPYLDILKIITFAPEEDEEYKFIENMKKHKNITLSIGHTNATFEQALRAMDNGVNYVTHTFNGMNGLHHRNPGVIGAVFSRDIYCEIIADTIHVHKGFFQAFIDINKKDKVILITDSMRAGCMKCGEYDLGGQRVIVDENSARLENKTLAGSILKLNEAVKNIKDNTNYKLNEIVNMASLNPAKAIGLDDKLGSIGKGKMSDLVIFDKNINILKTIINGNAVR